MSDDTSGVETARDPENYPAYKTEFVRKAEEIEGVVTQIEEHRYGHKFHAWQEVDDQVWMATIRTDNGENMDRDETKREVTFRECRPGHELHVFYSWSTVAVKALHGPSDLQSWRSIFRVFEAANELLRMHSEEAEGND